MDWALAIDRNRTALLRLLAMMIAAAGLVDGRAAPVLPPAARLMILRLLRPAESATRRLILIVKQRMAKRADVCAPRAGRALPAGGIPKGDGNRIPPFRLFDQRKFFPELSGGRRKMAGPGPRISGFDDGSWTAYEPKKPAPKTDPDPVRLSRRLLALQHALENLSKQARRLARVQSLRRAAGEALRRTEPMRPGMPPGYRHRQTHEIDEILSDCHQLALQVLATPNTS